MFRPYMAIIRFYVNYISLYKLREMRYDVEISHQITVPVYLCIGGYYPTLIYSVPPVVQVSHPGGVRPVYHRRDIIQGVPGGM